MGRDNAVCGGWRPTINTGLSHRAILVPTLCVETHWRRRCVPSILTDFVGTAYANAMTRSVRRVRNDAERRHEVLSGLEGALPSNSASY
jgi:hypothetical protein